MPKIWTLSIFFFLLTFRLASQVAPSFTSNTQIGCSPLVVNFTNTSQNATNYVWDFGNGIQSTLTNPSTTYTSPGFYTVKLIAQNATDTDSIIQQNYIQVLDLPTAMFSVVSISNCFNDNTFDFNNASSGAVSYTWDFNDGNTSTAINPSHQYNLTGAFNVTLVATNSSGCSHDTTMGPIHVYPNPNLLASIDTNLLCDSNTAVNFTGSSSNTSIANWSWRTGDGNISNTIVGNLAYNYNATGIFNPTLLATSTNGCIDSVTIGTINIVELENYSITSSSNSGCPPLQVNFNVTPHQNIQQISWDFGDGNSANTTPGSSHTFDSIGVFTVHATITDANGCIQQQSPNNNITISPTPTANSVVTNNVGCPPLNVQFDITTSPSNTILLDYGDTTVTSSNLNSSYNYVNSGEYYPTLLLTDISGCQTTYNLDTVQAGLDLTNFLASPSTGCAALEVDFTNTAPPSATSFHWDFGDGNTSTDPNPTHLYDTIGSYDVIFSCSDNSGCSSSYTIQSMITTYGEDDVVLPNPDTIYACSPYTFVADAGNIGNTYWNWDFGDGNFASGSNATNNYTQPGIYTVLLNADAPNGCMYNITNYAIIKIDDNMDIDLNITIDNSCGNGLINVINSSSGVIDHLWDMDDGGVVRTADVNHSFNTENSYMVTYQALSSSGCLVTQNIPVIFNCDANNNPIPNPPPIVIDESPDSLITGPLVDPITNNVITQTCGPELVNLSSPFSGAAQYFWDFGDGNNSNDQNPTHIYQNAGTFNLTHYATYPNGDKDTLIINGFVDQYLLDAEFTLTKTELCNEANYQFSNLSSNATSWIWTLDSNVISNQNNGNITLPLNDSVSILNLKIEDIYGCIDEKQQSIFLYQPLVLIEQDTFVCTQSANALFEASVIGDPIHSWNLGDGTTLGPDTAVYHTYNQNGFYHIELSLDNQGCIRTINLDSVEAYQPNSLFSPLTIGPLCYRDSILFQADDNSFSNNKYEWSGATLLGSGDSTWILFNDTASTNIKLSIKKRGCRSTTNSDTIIINKATANFSYNQLSYCVPIDVIFQDSSINPIDWNWQFGDGNTSAQPNPMHQFLTMPTDSTTLTITDINGCKDSLKAVIINELDAEFIASDTITCVNTNITFTSLDDVVNFWEWDLGDGTISNDSVVTHQYQTSGTYQVKLIVSDGQGCNDTVIKLNYIEVQEVVADFTYNPPASCPPIVTTFTNNSTNADSYLWDFGDSTSSIVYEPAHIYSDPGTYFVTLIASNNNGCADTLNYPDSLYVPGPQLNFSVNQLIGCDSLSVQVSDQSLYTVNYSFDFGDGTVIQSQSASHTYTGTGSYQITLVGEDAAGCQSFLTYSDTIHVYPTPTIDIQILDSNICLNEDIVPSNSTINANNHFWIYSGQNYSSLEPSINIDLIGSNSIKYIAENTNGGCKDSIEIAIIGHQIPDVSIINPGVICTNEGVITLQSLNQNQLGTLSWTGSAVTNSSQGLFDPNLVSLDSTLIHVAHDSICSSSDSLYVLIDNPPDATILTNDTMYCYGSSISQPVVLNSGGTWQGISTDPVTGAITAVLDTGFYTYNYILSNLNCEDTAAYSIDILYQNDASIAHPGTICDNFDTISLSSTDTGGIWSGMQINSTTGTIDISVLGYGNFDFIYSISGQCPDSDTLNLEIHQFIEASINQLSDFCEGTDSVQLTATTTIGNWSGLQNTHTQNGWFNTSNINDGIYEIYYTISGNCPDIDTTIINILPEPDISISVSQTLPCISYPMNIDNQSVNLSNEDYAWYVNDSLYYPNFNEPFFLFDTGFYTISTIASNQFGCTIDTVILDSVPIYDTTALPQPSIIRSTIIENSKVYTEWNGTSYILNPLNEYEIYRSENEGSFILIAVLDSVFNDYIDDNVDVFNNKYDYIIRSKNSCVVSSQNSNNGSSILLRYERPNDFKTRMEWNFYNQWDSGVKEYKIQKLNQNNQWQTINIIDKNTNELIIDQ